MTTPISDFDYLLPPNLIAQKPAEPRETARLMTIAKSSGKITHKRVSDLPDYLNDHDILVINNTKVFKAKLWGYITLQSGTKSKVEILLIRPITEWEWLTIGQPGKKLQMGRLINFNRNFSAEITKRNSDGTIHLKFNHNPQSVISMANRYGFVPIPHYIRIEPKLSQYQTSYAKINGSVAAPTAGFHLTPGIRKKLKKKGVRIAEVTLHVGLGTFAPVKTSTIEEHKMHGEWVEITSEAAAYINYGRKNGYRIVAVGTSTVRTLEGIAGLNSGLLTPYSGMINLYITPGYKFRIVDALITNFHLPKSTLIILVSAFAGRDNIRKAYNEAVNNKYRFYSFGDAMIIF